MRFQPLAVAGCAVVTSDEHADARGTFTRAFDAEAFAAAGHESRIAHVNLSTNARRGTLRGLHFQTGRHAEAKTIRVLSGAVYDVLADVRPDSPTFRQWAAVELHEEEPNALVAPAGVAHGYLTLRDDTRLLYLMSCSYEAGSASGVRWDDPVFSIAWPFAPTVMSDADCQWPDFEV
jgi:dTDP-4-dehydrorhamnose 3,5-epimerase